MNTANAAFTAYTNFAKKHQSIYGLEPITFVRPHLRKGYGAFLMAMYISAKALTHKQLNEALGITSHHHTTTLRRLRAGGLVEMHNHRYTITALGKQFVKENFLKC